MADSQRLGDMLTTINPSTGEDLERYPLMSDSDFESAIDASLSYMRAGKRERERSDESVLLQRELDALRRVANRSIFIEHAMATCTASPRTHLPQIDRIPRREG